MNNIMFSILFLVLGLFVGIIIMIILNYIKTNMSSKKAESIIDKANKEADKIPLINPSTVKIFKEEVSTEILVLILVIKEEKQILLWNKSSPILRIMREILDMKSINSWIIKKEAFIQIP